MSRHSHQKHQHKVHPHHHPAEPQPIEPSYAEEHKSLVLTVVIIFAVIAPLFFAAITILNLFN